MSAVIYEHVTVRSWAALSAAGDAAATWRAWSETDSHLQTHPTFGLCAPAYPLETPNSIRMQQLISDIAMQCSRSTAVPIETLPTIAFTASKGDSGRWLPPARPEAAWQFGPGHQAAELARHLGIRHYRNPQPVAACSTGLYALLAAADAIEYQNCQQAFAGAVDASLQPLLIAGFQSLGVLSKNPDHSPGFGIGEGAGLFHLQHQDHTNHTKNTWRLRAGVRLGDAMHETRCADPAVLEACLNALWQALPEPDIIVIHGTGTRAGDSYEHGGLDAGPWRHCIRAALKPIIGHCLGASSAVELAAALSSNHQRIWKLGLGFGGHIAGAALERMP